MTVPEKEPNQAQFYGAYYRHTFIEGLAEVVAVQAKFGFQSCQLLKQAFAAAAKSLVHDTYSLRCVFAET